jgi:hypothetical protein
MSRFLRTTKNSSMDVNMISKQKFAKIGMMGDCSNYHGHKNNKDYKIF